MKRGWTLYWAIVIPVAVANVLPVPWSLPFWFAAGWFITEACFGEPKLAVDAQDRALIKSASLATLAEAQRHLLRTSHPKHVGEIKDVLSELGQEIRDGAP